MVLSLLTFSTQVSYKQSFWFFSFVYMLLKCSLLSGSTTLVIASTRNETDRLALLAIKSQIYDDPLGALTSWNHSLHHCEWQGITCSRRHRDRVMKLDLESKKLEGTLSPYIGNLSFLREITLTMNNFHGEVPQEIGRLVRLQFLRLNNNSFQGEIPSNLTNCSELRFINLVDNKLSGNIFPELSSLSKLSTLGLGANNIFGKIPPSLGNLSSLIQLSIKNSHLEGSIPDDLCRIRSLVYLQLSQNNLTGKIPSCLFNQSNLRMISLETNQLQGSIPPNMGLALPNIQQIVLGDNQVSGAIPVSLSNATKLEVISFELNAFTGSVPSDLGKLQSLRGVSLDENQLGTKGGNDLNFITSLTNCSKLEQLAFAINKLKGPLPDSISNLSTTIRLLSLSGNSIYGSIPIGIGNLVNIQVISFSTNNLTNNIPSTIGKLSQLRDLYLGENLLSGHIPSSIGNLSQLNLLSLFSNNLDGSIPTTLGNCKNLAALDFSPNNLVGAIPIQVISLSSLTHGLHLHQNSLTGPLPPQVGNLTNILTLRISENKLSGNIPESLGNCLSLNELAMDGNFFEGEIPKSLFTLRGLVKLDISRNNLSGEIPEYLEQLQDLGYLNLSYNQLEGQVPHNGVFANASLVSVDGNHNLCGGIEGLKLSPCTQKKKRNQTSVSLKVIIPAIVGSLCLLFAAFFFLMSYRRKRNPTSTTLFNPSSSALFNPTYQRVSYLELFKATSGFSVDNMIGVGSYGTVFKGTLQEFQQTVAVKVLNLQREGASRSFLTECNALRNLRHRNLLKVITSCSSVDIQGNAFKALVFEFMPNGSVEDWLCPRVDEQQLEPRNLSFAQRLNIAIDVASALEYLHHHCHPGIVHCDLKPSNVLLEDDMTARVADFGIAKIFSNSSQDSSQSLASSVTIKGSIGYVAPEYGMGSKVSTQGDVYSYGILLLEMFTCKKPTDEMFVNGLSLHTYAEMALPNQIMGIVDPLMLLEENDKVLNIVGQDSVQGILHECLASPIRLGVACSADLPIERMLMSQVVSELHHIRDHYHMMLGASLE